jgi:hypothetical protein
MVRAVAAFSVTILCGLLLVSSGASAANNSNADALKKATADCRAPACAVAKGGLTDRFVDRISPGSSSLHRQADRTGQKLRADRTHLQRAM